MSERRKASRVEVSCANSECYCRRLLRGRDESGWSGDVGLKRLRAGGEHAVREVVPGSGPAKSAEGAGSYRLGGGSVLENLE